MALEILRRRLRGVHGIDDERSGKKKRRLRHRRIEYDEVGSGSVGVRAALLRNGFPESRGVARSRYRRCLARIESTCRKLDRSAFDRV